GPPGAAEDQQVARHIASDGAAHADQRILTEGHPAPDGRSGADAGTALDQRRHNLPVVRRQQFSSFTRGPRIPVIGETHVGADECTILDSYASRNEGEGLDLYVVAQDDAALNLHEGGDLAVVADGAPVQIDQLRVRDHDVAAEADVGRD